MMWDQIAVFLGPLILGIILTTALEAATGKTWGILVRRSFKRGARKRLQRYAAQGELIQRDDEALYVIEYVPGGWQPQHIRFISRPKRDLEAKLRSADERSLPGTPEGILSAVVTERQRLADAPGDEWNGASLAVDLVRTSRTETNEHPTLTIGVSASDYAAAAACGAMWEERFTEGTLTLPATPDKVIPGMLHAVGLNATVVTDDGQLLLVRRSTRASSGRGGWHISVNEGMVGEDVNQDHKLDPHVGVARGVLEELGVRIDPSLVRFHTAMFDVRRYQFGLLGHVDLTGTGITAFDFRIARQIGHAKDKFENREIVEVPWNFDAVVQQLNEPDWLAHGWLNLIHSAIESFSPRKHELYRLLGERGNAATAQARPHS